MLNEKQSELIQIIRSLLKVDINEEIFTFKEFQEFLSSDRITFLKISYLPASNKILLLNNDSSKSIQEKEISITFHKVEKNKSELNLQNFLEKVDMTYTKQSSKLICNELDSSILQNFKYNKNDPHAINFFENFKEKLLNFEKKIKSDKIVDGVSTEENFELVFTPEEEIEFWKIQARISSNERSKKISGSFLKIEKYFSENFEIGSENVNEVLTGLVGCCEDILHDITIIPKVNPNRVKNFLEVSLDQLANKISASLNKINFSENSPQQLMKLLEYQKAIKFIFERILGLNRVAFKEKQFQISSTNSLDVDAIQSSPIEKIFQRINDVIELKSLFNDVNKLMPELNLTEIFKQNSITGNSSDVSGKIIDDYKSIINQEIEKVELEIVEKLNTEIFANNSHVISTLRDMQNWKNILNRKSIMQSTYSRRKDVLKDLNEHLTQLEKLFEERSQDSIDDTISSLGNEKIYLGIANNISPKISKIIWSHTLKQKCEMCKKLSQSLKDIESYNTFYNKCEATINKISEYIEENLQDWSNSFGASESLKKNLLPKFGSDLIEINQKTGELIVNFSEKLFIIIQDLRVITEYGYASKVPKNISEISDEGKKILKEAVSLKQIANFYNTLSSQVIECQKPMLVQCAKDFESNLFLLTERSKLSKLSKLNSQNISTTFDLEIFVNLVQNAATDLTKEIRKLKKSHSTILDLVSQLLNYDLISNKTKWKEILNKSRNVFREAITKYEDVRIFEEWKSHWNFQLYKVLKIQYTLSLEKFFQYVTEVDCEFVIVHKQLNVNPPIEELRKIIYKEIKSFVSIPSLIRGIVEDDLTSIEYFQNLISKNSQNIHLLYLKSNEAMNKLETLRDSLSEIIGLSYIDYENFIMNNFSKIEDWKNNFDFLRKKFREIEKMDDVIKIDCIRINLNSYKTFAENSFEEIFEILGTSLKERIRNRIATVDEFVKDGMEKMNKKSLSMNEIIIFKQNYIELTRKKFEYKKQNEEIEEMNKLLTNITGQSLNLQAMESRWLNFDSMMNSYSHMIEEQKENIKKDLEKKIKDVTTSLEKFYSKWQAVKIPDNFIPDSSTNMSEISTDIRNTYEQWNSIENEISLIFDECKNFEIEIPKISIFEDIKAEIIDNKNKWELFFEFNESLSQIKHEDWLGIRHKAFNIIQDLTMNWQDRMKKREKDFIYYHITSVVETFKQSLQVYKYLIGDNFERDHWKSLFNILKLDNKITKENLIFGNFIERTELLIKKSLDIKELYSRAQGEILIRNAISELTAWFETAEFQFTEYINQTNNRKTPLIKEWKEMMNEISEKQALLISVKSSEFFSRFSDQIEQFENKFSNLDVWLGNLNLIQRKWVYLEPIFSRGSLPKEQARFKKIDDEFRNILLILNTSLRVNSIFTLDNIKDTLDMLIDQLEKCQKALNDFLDDKRNKFARLYFLGDDDLLEFLAKSKEKSVIKSNLKKLYQGITNLSINDTNPQRITVSCMESAIGEQVLLGKEVFIVDELENWLNELTKEMRSTLMNNLFEGVKKFSKNDLGHLDAYCYQISGLIENLNFTYLVDNCLKNKNSNLHDVLQLVIKTISSLTIMQAKCGGNTVKLFKIKNLMLDLIHNREVVEVLIKNSVSELLDWDWYSQLKYQIFNDKSATSQSGENTLKISMCDGFFDYTYEYQGASQKLVHTPLTDKCYLTLTQAIKLGYGGNPYGPAGTGKTESVKALGQVFGRQILVFNCDEGIDFKSMGRIFIGLVKSGAWGCFDEFNRLLEEQLSAISIQIQIIQYALKNRIETVSLLNQSVNVNQNSAIFVTLNPAGKGYGGRSKLPDNLKILFRPVAMSVPDNQQIAQTLLYAEGFKHAGVFAQKIVALFTLCKQGLSNQQHYDWGLRALKTILTVANQQIQIFLNQGLSASYEDEVEVLIKAIRINVLSKLTFEDSRNFNLLIEDVFPGVKMTDISYEELNKSLLESYSDLSYEYIDSQFKKVVQFYEACRQRMGVVLVGPSGCGKSSIWKLLKAAYAKLKQEVRVYIINPKSMPRNLLLGHMNHDTGEYSYGVLTKCAKEIEKEPSTVKCWIICDGDVDPEWIEALNSVLDDNRLLTMQNGERINFGSNVNFIFETDSLKFASHATISRMGIIYMNQEDLDINSIIKSWVKKNSKGTANSKLLSWFENYFFEIYNNYLANNSLMLKTTNYGSISNFLSLLSINNDSRAGFTDSLIKGLGSNLSYEQRKKFAVETISAIGDKPSNILNPLNNYYDKKSSSIREYVTEIDFNSIDLKAFSSLKSNPIIKTKSVLRDLDTIKIWLDNMEPFIIIGPEGCGKSLLINHAISNLKSCHISVINCTSQTSSSNVIQKLLQNCTISNTSKGRCLRPKDCQKLILYLKDINLPKPDKYETIQLISFLQQIVTYQGFYDENLEFLLLDKIQIIASMNPASTVGRFEITTRFTGNVRIMYLDYPINEELFEIYHNYMKAILSVENLSCSGEGVNELFIKNLTESTLSIYNSVKSTFLPDENRHYIFSPREISNWLIGLVRYEVKSKDELVTVWAYESSRIFRDRLVCADHKSKFDKFLINEITTRLKINFDLNSFISKIYTGLNTSPSKIIPGVFNMSPILKEEYIDLLQKGKLIYERENQDLFFYHFDEYIHWYQIIDRLVNKTMTNLLLIGTNSIGRKKTVKIVASYRNFEIFAPSLTKDYGMKEFKKNIKDVFYSAGVEGRNTIFLIEEHHIAQSEILEYINSILCSGEVPGLFSNEEIEAFYSNLTNDFKEQNEHRSIYEFLISRIRKYLKLVILIDYDNKEFNNYLLNNPALITKCEIVWFNEFSKTALTQFCKEELKETFDLLIRNKMLKSNSKDVIDSFVNEFIRIYQNVKENNLNATHAKFIEFILQFKLLVRNKLDNSSQNLNHLQSGLNQLVEAEKYVEELSLKSKEEKIQIELKSKEANETLIKIQDAMIVSANKKSNLEILSKEIAEETFIVEENRGKVEFELKDLMPEVERAKNLIKSLDPSSMAEMKQYFKAAILKSEIYIVLKAALQLIGYSDLTSEGVKSTFDMSTISQLKNFDIKKLSKENAKKASVIVNSNPTFFQKEYAEKINVSSAKISEYVKAITKFYAAKEVIRPLEIALEEVEAKVAKSKAQLNSINKDLIKIDKGIEEHKQNFAKKMGEAELLKIHSQKTEDLLNKAKSLLGKLTGEKIRWQNQINELNAQNEILPYNTMLSSAFITFLGYYNESIRERLMSIWKSNLDNDGNKNFMNITKFLFSESDSLRLKSMALPTDDLSLENAAIIQNSIKTTLIIDPVTKATNWFQNSIRSKNQAFEVVSLQDPKLLTNIELAIRFGKILLITDVDKIEPFLVPLIRNETSKRGPVNIIRLGDKVIDRHDRFKLYLSTRDSSVEISNNILSSLSVVNFTVTRSGLEALLLGMTIDIEQPELEKKKNELLEDQDKIKLELAEVEKKLLEELIHIEGNLIENKALIESLEESKEKSIKSETSLQSSLQLSIEIDNKRDIYKPLSKLATVIYLLLQDLYKINPMYQFSLENFLSIFRKTIKDCNSKSSSLDFIQKISHYVKSITKESFVYYSRSIFKSDLLLYGLFFIKSIYYDNEDGKEKLEWDFLLDNANVTSTISDSSKIPHWVPIDRKEIFSSFVNSFSLLANNCKFTIDNKVWEAICKSPIPEKEIEKLDSEKINPISSLQKMILIKVLRPDRLESAMKNFICNILDLVTINPSSLSLNQLIQNQEDNRIPILFVTTLGSDPSRELEDFAEEQVGRSNYFEIPMGAGENEKIITEVKEAALKGSWICLKNLHLSISWLPTLEKEIKNLKEQNKNFRLFLTSEPHHKFSTILLQTCTKVTYETPPGIKKNMERIYQIWSNSLLKEISPSTNNSEIILQTLFATALIHAILQERRTYIPQGWSKFYEFSYSDLKVSAETIADYLKNYDNKKVWKNIQGLIINSFYGGRIDNDFDLKVMITYVNIILNRNNLLNPDKKILNKFPVLMSNNIKSYSELISTIPEIDDPELFGLPSNVDRSVQRYRSAQVIQNLNNIYSISSEEKFKFDKILWGEKLSPILNIWKGIYNCNQLEALSLAANKININEDPLKIFIKSEAVQIYELAKAVEHTLSEISQTLFSIGVVTSQILKNSNCLLRNRIPEEWNEKWSGPELPSSFLKSLGKKINGVINYANFASNETLLENNINLSELLHPEAFIGALRQKSARKYKIPIDELSLGCSFGKSLGKQDEVMTKISGLFLQGSDFDGKQLISASEDKSEIIGLPPMNLFWLDSKKNVSLENEMEIPVYENIFRENFICKLKIPITGNVEDTILKGIAICLDSN